MGNKARHMIEIERAGIDSLHEYDTIPMRVVGGALFRVEITGEDFVGFRISEEQLESPVLMRTRTTLSSMPGWIFGRRERSPSVRRKLTALPAMGLCREPFPHTV